MKSYLTDLDVLYARERTNDLLRETRHLQLVREAETGRKAAAPQQQPISLIARLRAALLTRWPVRA